MRKRGGAIASADPAWVGQARHRTPPASCFAALGHINSTGWVRPSTSASLARPQPSRLRCPESLRSRASPIIAARMVPSGRVIRLRIFGSTGMCVRCIRSPSSMPAQRRQAGAIDQGARHARVRHASSALLAASPQCRGRLSSDSRSRRHAAGCSAPTGTRRASRSAPAARPPMRQQRAPGCQPAAQGVPGRPVPACAGMPLVTSSRLAPGAPPDPPQWLNRRCTDPGLSKRRVCPI